jgi:hypothetical protein
MPQRNKTVIGYVAWRRKRKIEKWRGTAQHDTGDPPLADQVHRFADQRIHTAKPGRYRSGRV